jgi:hypothetical protein
MYLRKIQFNRWRGKGLWSRIVSREGQPESNKTPHFKIIKEAEAVGWWWWTLINCRWNKCFSSNNSNRKVESSTNSHLLDKCHRQEQQRHRVAATILSEGKSSKARIKTNISSSYKCILLAIEFWISKSRPTKPTRLCQ